MDGIEIVDGQRLCVRWFGFLWRRHCWHGWIERLEYGRCQAKRPVIASRCCLCSARSFTSF